MSNRKNQPMESKKYACIIPWCSYRVNYPGQSKNHVNNHIDHILSDSTFGKKTRKYERPLKPGEKSKIVVEVSVQFNSKTVKAFASITPNIARLVVFDSSTQKFIDGPSIKNVSEWLSSHPQCKIVKKNSQKGLVLKTILQKLEQNSTQVQCDKAETVVSRNSEQMDLLMKETNQKRDMVNYLTNTICQTDTTRTFSCLLLHVPVLSDCRLSFYFPCHSANPNPPSSKLRH